MRVDCKIKILTTILLLAINVCFIHAQKAGEEKYYTNSSRHWTVELPVWVPKFRGQFAYGDFDFSSSGNKEEREFERLEGRAGLEFYFVGRVMARYDKLWGK